MWELVAWRPLVSYRQTQWKSLPHFAGAYCTHVIRLSDLGFHVDNPRQLVEEIHAYNLRRRLNFLTTQLGRSVDVEDTLLVMIFDLKNFFPEVPLEEFYLALAQGENMVRTRDPTWRFF